MVVRPWHIAAGTDAESWQNPPDLETRFLHQWMSYCMDLSLKTADFQTEQRVRDHWFRPKLHLHGLISATIS
jgi:hypothetical protein